MEQMKIKTDCRYFNGDIPCKPHKQSQIHCPDCQQYEPMDYRILIIKLGAIGDVIRTTPLLKALKQNHPHAQISWLTYSPDILPSGWVDNILPVSIESITWLKANTFDWLINLDKEPLAIALAKDLSSEKKSGFIMDALGHCKPMATEAEEHKWLTGLWDDVNAANTLNYMEEIFNICGLTFQDETYILEDKRAGQVQWNLDEDKIKIGLNTGCGGRWTSRLWPETYWIELAKKLETDGLQTVLLGGAQEHEKNLRIAKQSGATYLGHFDLPTFVNLVAQMDVVVTAVTMAMHLAIGLKRKLVLFNNIFNKHEFHLYNRGVIVEPEMECNCYFSPTCPNNCMTTLSVNTVYKSILNLSR